MPYQGHSQNEHGDKMQFSPDENDPCFPYVMEPNTSVKLPNGITLHELLGQTSNCEESPVINHVKVTCTSKQNIIEQSDCEYDADSEDYVNRTDHLRSNKNNKQPSMTFGNKGTDK